MEEEKQEQLTLKTLPAAHSIEKRTTGLKILQTSKKSQRTCSTAEQLLHEDS